MKQRPVCMAPDGICPYTASDNVWCLDCKYYSIVNEGEENVTEFEKMVQFMDLSFPMRKEIVPCLMGPPGIGKTAAVEQHVRNLGHGKMVKIVASRCIPSETVGMTMPDHEHRSMDIYNSRQLSSLEDGDVLFFDELLEADQFVLSTLLTLIESREMADGTPLPDIQIIAATNATIPSSQLKDNIKQRFMFKSFGMDTTSTIDYVSKHTGLDISGDLVGWMRDKSEINEYNYLSPRSLTKLSMWISEAKPDDVPVIAEMIDGMFKRPVGTALAICRSKRDSKPEDQVRSKVKEIINGLSTDIDVNAFDDMSIEEMTELLKSLPEWERIAEELADTEIKEVRYQDQINF